MTMPVRAAARLLALAALLGGGAAAGDDDVPTPSVARIDYGRPERYLAIPPSFGDEAHIHRLGAPLRAGVAEQTLANIGGGSAGR